LSLKGYRVIIELVRDDTIAIMKLLYIIQQAGLHGNKGMGTVHKIGTKKEVKRKV